MQTTRPVIGFLTDFGMDGAAATCRGVMLSICRDAQIVDISHTIAKFAIRDGAFVLAAALPYLPIGHHVGVVDPGVGTDRRPIGISTARGDVLIGPDNGLLPPAADALGGIDQARVLANHDLWLRTVTSTFHGRDLFSPVAAHLAVGRAEFSAVGPVIHPDSLVRLPHPTIGADRGVLEIEVVYVDSYGNLRLAGESDTLERAFGEVTVGSSFVVTAGHSEGEALPAVFVRSFGAVAKGSALLYVDSSGNLAAAENQGNLAGRLGLMAGQTVRIVRAAH